MRKPATPNSEKVQRYKKKRNKEIMTTSKHRLLGLKCSGVKVKNKSDKANLPHELLSN